MFRKSWSRITVVLKTSPSGSRSVAVPLYEEPGQGCRLIYHYENRPQLGEPELACHYGLCTHLFSDEFDWARHYLMNVQRHLTTQENATQWAAL